MNINIEKSIKLVERFNGVDFSSVTKDQATMFMLSECFKNGLSLGEAGGVINQVRL